MMQYVKRFSLRANEARQNQSMAVSEFVATIERQSAATEVNVLALSFENHVLRFSFARRRWQTRNRFALVLVHAVAYCYGRRCVQSRGAQNIQNGRRLFMFINTRDECSWWLLRSQLAESAGKSLLIRTIRFKLFSIKSSNSVMMCRMMSSLSHFPAPNI